MSEKNKIDPLALGLDSLLRLPEVAGLLGLSERSVWREVQRERLATPVPGKPARWFKSDVEAYMELLRGERLRRAA